MQAGPITEHGKGDYLMHADTETLTAMVQDQFGRDHQILLQRQPNGHYKETGEESPESFTAMVEGQFGFEHRIRLVRQPDGKYEEVIDASDHGQI